MNVYSTNQLGLEDPHSVWFLRPESFKLGYPAFGLVYGETSQLDGWKLAAKLVRRSGGSLRL